MKISVAISTWNRSAPLRRTLESVCEASPPETVDWEVVVVNNNSTDQTAEVISSFADRLPLVSVFESRPGVSHGRNAAAEAATGDLWAPDPACYLSDEEIGIDGSD